MENQTQTTQNADMPEHLIYAKGDKPFKSLATVKSAIANGKEYDPMTHVPVPVGKDEFAIGRLAVERPPTPDVGPKFVLKEEKPKGADSKNVQGDDYVETYWWVKFHAKSNPIDPEDVSVAVNGEVLQAPREIDTIMPNRFLLAIDAATIQKFSQMPGQPRKNTARIRKFPYDRLRESSEAEYNKWKKRHTAANREHIRRYGPEVTPDMVEDNMR